MAKGKFRRNGQQKFPKKINVLEEVERKEKLYGQIPESNQIRTFSQFPLSDQTAKGLLACKYSEPTEIQRECLSIALRGADVLGAAKTGSGKTLAFVIPVLECLWRKQWTLLDAMGALIISPTRELAYQIFQVLRNVGQKHDFSAALLIGGTDLEYERKRLANINIVVCTPGRLLQHMDENPEFSCLNLQILVIDEADRILDMGFSKQINSVIENLPTERQTLLFSATQTKSVKDLARLSLVDPIYVSVHENSLHSTPDHLTQSYVVCSDENKMNMLWSFLKNHSHKKVLVFLSSCRQVRYVVDSLKLLQPGISLFALHGGLNQTKRMISYNQFCDSKHCALIATDLAARGLDFPSVDWVLQLDCPADADEYIHRSGRTARYNAKGEALLVLTPCQSAPMLTRLQNKKIPLSEIQINPKKLTNIQSKLATLCASDHKLKSFAQMYFLSYYRAVFCMRDKQVFDVNSIDPEPFAKSLGLAFAPKVKFLRDKKLSQANLTHANSNAPRIEESNELGEDDIDVATHSDPAFGVDADSDNDLFSISKTQRHCHIEKDPQYSGAPVDEVQSESKKGLSRVAFAKKLLKSKKFKPQKKVFLEEDEEQEINSKGGQTSYSLSEAKKSMKDADKQDRMRYAKLAKLKKLKKKAKKRKIVGSESEDSETNDADEFEVILGGPQEILDPEHVKDPTNSYSKAPHSSRKKKRVDETPELLAKRMLGLE